MGNYIKLGKEKDNS